MFVFEALKASHGDAFLLHGNKTLIMVDGGPSNVYDNVLHQRLTQLDPAGEVLKIALLMVSHIDDDHINGILDLTKELLSAKLEHRAPIASIDHLWHNSFTDDILSFNSVVESESDNSVQGALRLSDLIHGSSELHASFQESSRMVLASVRQGRQLRQDAQSLRIKSNFQFPDSIVLRQGDTLEEKRIGEFSLAILGPTKAALDDLRKKWEKDLKEIPKKNRSSESALELAANLDNSIANLSSLVVQVSINNKTALLTGDARSDHILSAMEEVGWPEDEKWPVDLLKVPHHGSDRNVTEEFFAKVPAHHYVISGNGKDGNPEPNTFEMIFSARCGEKFKLHLTYDPKTFQQQKGYDWCGFKRVMERYNGWSCLQYPDENNLSIKVKLA